MSSTRKHSYTIEKAAGSPEGDESVTLTRVTLTKGGWIMTGKMTFPNRAEALAKIMRSHGFGREIPPNYGMGGVVEYWYPPAHAHSNHIGGKQ